VGAREAPGIHRGPRKNCRTAVNRSLCSIATADRLGRFFDQPRRVLGQTNPLPGGARLIEVFASWRRTNGEQSLHRSRSAQAHTERQRRTLEKPLSKELFRNLSHGASRRAYLISSASSNGTAPTIILSVHGTAHRSASLADESRTWWSAPALNLRREPRKVPKVLPIQKLRKSSNGLRNRG